MDIELLLREALHRGLDPHISSPITLLGRLITLPLDTVALVLSQVAPLINKFAFITGVVTFLTRLVAPIRG